LILGVTGNTDAFIDLTAGAVAALLDDVVVDSQAAGIGIIMAEGDQFLGTIGTAALLAGRVSLYIEGYRVD
jgi:hypothetical protein